MRRERVFILLGSMYYYCLGECMRKCISCTTQIDSILQTLLLNQYEICMKIQK